MFFKLGYTVKELNRSRYGKFTLKNLQKGEYRELTESEIKKLIKK